MQSAPIRLQQAIWTAFKAARPNYGPITQNLCRPPTRHVERSLRQSTPLKQWPRPLSLSQVRYYTDDNKKEIEKKIEDAQNKIDESIGSRPETTRPEESPLKNEETIIHTIPESSSIVHNPDSPGETAARGQSARHNTADSARTRATFEESRRDTSDSTSQSPPWHAQLPSQLKTQYSNVRHNFNSFMDNFQTHIFTASKRLNDLTGYSSIERLKQDIEDQEHSVRAARQHVRDSRAAYSAAIETRSATQREVNDLLHRKHAWSSGDLERFTSLYRSDHANEQDETKAHSDLSAAEAAYEEASTKLSKSILARYHEEQVWSDKIRQMSTWGTWGLMGLNVLLFIVFQIMIEPWRRRRLVRGFEEKVQDALKTNAEDKQLIANLQAEKIERHQAVEMQQAGFAPAVATAVMGETVTPVDDTAPSTGQAISDETSTSPTASTTKAEIEQAAEVFTTAEVLSTSTTFTPPTPDSTVPSTPLTVDPSTISESVSTNATPTDAETTSPPYPVPFTLSSLSSLNYAELPTILGSHTRHYLDLARTKVEALFDEQARVTMTRREVTSKVLEGAFFGVVGVVTVFWVVGVGRR